MHEFPTIGDGFPVAGWFALVGYRSIKTVDMEFLLLYQDTQSLGKRCTCDGDPQGDSPWDVVAMDDLSIPTLLVAYPAISTG
ncbi:MAG: hypothetical protein ACKN81_20705 [Pirellulaceae bacterium]